MVEQADLRFSPLAGDPRDWMISQARLKATATGPAFYQEFRRFRAKHCPLMRRMLDDSRSLIEGADAIVYSHGALAGPHLAEATGLPSAYAGLQPWEPTAAHPSVMFGQRQRVTGMLARLWNQASHPLGEHLVWQPWRGVVNRWRTESLGLPPLPLLASPWAGKRFERARVYGYSPRVAPPPPDWPEDRLVSGWWHSDKSTGRQANATGRQADAELLRFLAEGAPPVYVGFGSQVPAQRERTAEAVVGALRHLGVRALVARGWGDLELGRSDGRIFQIDTTPHDWLFPKVAAVVHHGGAGTTGVACRAGVPQVIVPAFFDQFFWAERLRQLGVAPAPLPAQRFGSSDLSDALSLALEPEVGRRAALLAEELRGERGAVRAAEFLLHRLFD